MKPEAKYQEISDSFGAKIDSLTKSIVVYGWSRLIVFVLFGSAVYFFRNETVAASISGVAGFILFLYLVRTHAAQKARREHYRRVKSYADFEKSFLAGEKMGDHDGKEFINSSHPFTSDLDIFGPSSIFQFLNRTKSEKARRNMAEKLRYPTSNVADIEKNRRIISDFARSPLDIFEYLSHSEQAELDLADTKSSTAGVQPYPRLVYIFLCIVLPAAMVSITFGYFLGFMTWSLYSKLVLIPALPVLLTLKRNMADFSSYEQRLNLANAFEKAFALLRAFNPQEDETKKMFEDLDLNQSQEAFRSLKKINGAIDSRNNIFVGILLNLLLLWDFQCHRRLSKWDREWSSKFDNWIKLAYEIEAIQSLALYVHNFPQFNYAELNSNHTFSMEQARHVLLHHNGVPNDFKVGGERKFVIVTGANMAGKSTYLRTVGTNLIMSMVGLPVPVTAMSFTPTKVFTSMVTADNLGEGESYFFSELKRLKELVDILEKDQYLFVILDEILKGTNSRDKAEGSQLFLEKLLDLPAYGLIATHDLSLCKIEEVHPKAIKNYSFEVEFRDGDLHFDYTLNEGVCQNMNARFLLQRMGLTKTTSPKVE
jgi:DNA mismatch repair ATPase MutS